MTETNKKLYTLKELSDYKVADDYSDVRGWDVKDANNRTIGKVDRLLVNKVTERVVYLDVEIDSDLIDQGHDTLQTPVSDGVHTFVNKDGDNHLIIPIGMVNIDEEKELVTTNQIDSHTFANTKRFRKGDDIDFDYELDVVRHYKGDDSVHSSMSDEDFYNREEFYSTYRRRDLE